MWPKIGFSRILRGSPGESKQSLSPMIVANAFHISRLPVSYSSDFAGYRSNFAAADLWLKIEQMNLSRLSRLWIFGVCALVSAQAVVSLTLRRGFALIALSDTTQLILLFSGTAALFLNALRTQGRTRLFWTLMTLGLLFWSSYQCLWTFFEVYLRREVPNPFGGDVVLFLHLVPMMAALAVQPHRELGERSIRAGSLDFTMLLFWWIYLYLFTVIPWQYVFRSEMLYEHNLNVVYLTEKVVFLAG